MKISKSLVFDIKRFAVHDGDGIRTTIFFKGCPLNCQWCQNPEGISSKKQLLYFLNRCIHCQSCRYVSSDDQLTYENDRPYFHLDYQGRFDHIIEACPASAIRYDSENYDADELMKKIKEDKVFFDHGGGVTFSGGEPLMQREFLIELLKRCKAENIHTAIETTLYAPWDIIALALPFLDLIYADFKVFSDVDHQAWTGVSNEIIKANFVSLLTSPYKDHVIVRTPLIPTKTATDENIVHIVQFLTHLDSNVHYELLNYNPLAASKYDLLNREYPLKTQKMLTPQKMQHFYDLCIQSGIKNLIKE